MDRLQPPPKIAPAFSNPLGLLFGNVTNRIGAAIDDFISDLVYGLKGATGGLVDLTGLLNATSDKAESAENAANEAIENTGQVVQQVSAIVNSITAPFAESWMTMTPGQQVSFPRALLNTNVKSVDGSTGGGGSSEGTHSHSVYSSTTPIITPDKNVLCAAFIQSNYAVGRATITFVANGVSSPCQLYVIAARMLENGDAQIVWVSEDQTPLMSIGRVEYTVTSASDMVYNELEQMIVGVHQIGAGNVRNIMGVEMAAIPRTGDLYPPQQAMNFSTSSVITAGAVIPRSSQSFSSLELLWIGIGQRLFSGDPIPRSFVDGFNRGSLGPTWTMIGLSPGSVRDGAYFTHGGGRDDKSFNYWSQPLAYDDQRVEADAVAVNSREQGIICRGNPAGSQFFALVINDSGAALRQWTAKGDNNFTPLASWSGATTGTRWAIEAIGDTLTAYQRVDGVWLERMQVVGVTLLVGRYTGLFCDRDFFTNSGVWDNFSSRDMVEIGA